MSEVKHTPGPWTACAPDEEGHASDSYRWSIRAPGCYPPVLSFRLATINSMNTGNEESDAHLIAAAPEMHAALQAVIDFIDGKPGAPGPVGLVRAALAKAVPP